MAIEDWERVLDAAGERVTIRIPRLFREQMDVRARNAGRSLNEEYGRAIEAWCGGGEGWTSLLLPSTGIHDWVTAETIKEQQLGAVLVDALTMDDRYIGIRLAGYVVTLDRQWFRSDEAFQAVQEPLSKNLPLIAESGGGWGPGPYEATIYSYGRVGQACRKNGCKAEATELVKLKLADERGSDRIIDVPLCRVHAHETRATIASGVAPKFSLG